jgi:hypothetical protein
LVHIFLGRFLGAMGIRRTILGRVTNAFPKARPVVSEPPEMA